MTSLSHAVLHGGALKAAMRAYPHAPKPWLDLSTGINPHPYPIGEVPIAAWTRLPEREEVAALEDAAARAYRAGGGTRVVAAPGAQALIQLLPQLFPARRVAILGPTYAEHEARWRAGADVMVVDGLAAVGEADAVVVVNPNNPDGRVTSVPDLLRLAERARLLVVDESFMDLSPTASLAPHIGDRPVVILRSFGKTYGLAGLRLGFALAPPRLAEQIRDALGPWAVSGPALAIGTRALGDAGWLAAMRTRLVADAAHQPQAPSGQKGVEAGGTPLFRLAACGDAHALHAHLCRHGVLARVFDAQPHWVRFGLPRDEADWDRLACALACRSEPVRTTSRQ